MRGTLVAIGLAVVAALIVGIIGNDFYLRVMFSICVYFLCAVGTNVLVGYAGQKSLGQAGLFAAGAYSAALLTTSWDMNPWLALIVAVVISALFGILIAAPSLRVRGPSLAMVTLAFGIVVEKLVTETSDVFGGAMGIYAIKSLTFNGSPFDMKQWVWFGILASLAVYLLLRNLLTGRFGRALLSIQADEIAASAMGVPVLRYKIIAFVIAAATCGLAGALVAQQNQYINSDFINFNLSIFILLLVMFGGSGSLAGPLLGAVFLTILNSVLARWTWAEHFANGALLLFALYVMPRGLAGFLDDVLSKFGRQRAASPAPPLPAVGGLAHKVKADRSAVLLQAQGISKSYGGVKPAQNLDATLIGGSIHALIGPNGAGKSTFINILSGIVRPDKGTITFRGESIAQKPVHAICARGIARTFQNLRLFKDLSVRTNILVGQHRCMTNGIWLSLLGLPAARREEAKALGNVEAIMQFVGLADFADKNAGGLAYGLQRRVELARALATEPDLLLLDEPAAGLNPQETAELGDLLVRIRDQGITMLLVEHHMDLVMKIADYIIVLDYGEKIAEGTPSMVQNNSKVTEAYLGVDDPDEECVPIASAASAP
ncbi:branched-chain amino acid ABC transporter ATP-binding protein/permease [Tardiphaga sp. vice154]|uniref:branched-chain amino acid ABC transporter ATP-binding protein/permease n=1 Tax=Tardiphaga sp. vice154 TaxID=2592814 RepID=UPI001162ABBB|nr:branched-chain amino acid ABC transporter ATP-binding protein/permease [Tardiphaga sp. vice154]QDM22166.1 branched-chain amino acid ABC transporter ATP-binding protein/permease [Tardiphaga sp. vice154]